MAREFNQRLFNKGRQTPVSPLLEQTRGHVELGRKFETDLDSFGWPKANTDALAAKTDELDAGYSSRKSDQDESLEASRNESANRQSAKAYIRRLRLAAPILLRGGAVNGVTQDSFNAGENLGNSTVKISKYLMKVRPSVEKLEKELSPYFGGKSPAGELEAVKSALDASDAAQETLRSGLPEATVDLCLLAGEILEMIEDMNRVGKIAFDGCAEIAGQFNKDLILRASKRSKTKPEAAGA
jgi:hypothetical protein